MTANDPLQAVKFVLKTRKYLNERPIKTLDTSHLPPAKTKNCQR